MLRMLKGRIKNTSMHQSIVSADVNTSSVDLKDFNSLTLLFSIGAFAFDGSNKVALKIEESDDDSTFTAVDAADLDGEESANIVKTVDTAPEGNQAYECHYKGNKRYVRAVLDITGTVSFAASVHAVLGHPELMPPL